MDDSLQLRWCLRVERQPDARALAFYNSRGEYAWRSRGELYERGAASAARLADHGLRAGDVCLLVLPSEEFCATAVLGVLMTGAVPLLAAPPVLQDRDAYSSLMETLTSLVCRTKPRIVLCPESMSDRRAQLEQRRSRTRFLFGEESLSGDCRTAFWPATPASDDVAAMQLTSGTTGSPRVCVWKQKSVTAALDGMAQAMGLTGDDVYLNWTPLYHDMGLANTFLLCLTRGLPLVMLRPHDFVASPALWLRGLSQTGATITWSPNFGFALAAQRARDEQLRDVRLDRVRGFWNAAERIHLETMREFHRRFAPLGVREEALKTNFGCAENIGGATFSGPGRPFCVERVDRTLLQEKGIARTLSSSEGDGKGISVVGVGRGHPNLKIRILSRTRRFLPDGQVGEIALESPSRMEGYLGDARATRRAIDGGLLRTGDLGYLRDGELFWVGRARERIAVRGVKLDPSDFESILLQVAGLRHGCFAVFGVDDGQLGTQRLVVIAEVRDSNPRDPAEIIADIRKQALLRLGANVDEVLLVRRGTLTKTSSGKRRHRFYRRLYLAGELEGFRWRPEPSRELAPSCQGRRGDTA